MSFTPHVLSVVHHVSDVRLSEAFFESVLSLPARLRGEDWAVLDNGSVALRLVQSGVVGPDLVLELSSHDLDAALAALGGKSGVRVVSRPEWVSPSRQEAHLVAPDHGVVLVLSRDYDEDELGVVPPLPTELPWKEPAVEIVQSLLLEVPVVFRGPARERITRRAEFLAVEGGEVEVEIEHGVRAVVQVTPAFQLARLRQSLERRGLVPSRWEPDFER